MNVPACLLIGNSLAAAAAPCAPTSRRCALCEQADPAMDSFFKENLILPKSLTNLEYGGTQMPLKIVTWPSMLTGGTLTAERSPIASTVA